MRPPAYLALVEKSRAACVAAVETYNRVSAPYREENFAILMINAWELLLKARVIQENGGKVSAIYEWTHKLKKDKTPSKKKVLKLTGAKLPYTIGVDKARNLCSGYSKNKLEDACAQNIEALLVIRDSATHFVVKSALLNHRLAEISLAAVRNYVIAAQKWFKVTFDDLNIASIPLSFALDQKNLEAVAKKQQVAVVQFLAYMQAMENAAGSTSSDSSFSVKVEFDLTKKKADGAVSALIVGPKDNPQVTVAYEANKLPDGFDWDYGDLCGRLGVRYSDFLQNQKYHQIRKPLESNPKLCHERYLDPQNTKSTKKRYYSPNIVVEFDKHYTTKSV
jgi:hypothetical protein